MPALATYSEVLSRPLFLPTRRPSEEAPVAMVPMSMTALRRRDRELGRSSSGASRPARSPATTATRTTRQHHADFKRSCSWWC